MEFDLPLQAAAHAESKPHAHPTTAVYVKIGLFLALVTAVEIGIVYVKGLRGLMLPLLFGLAAVKFGTVAGFFMHLKFDNRFLTWVFAAGLFVAVLFVLALMYMLAV